LISSTLLAAITEKVDIPIGIRYFDERATGFREGKELQELQKFRSCRKRFWSRLQKPHVVLWNDSPALLQQLANHGSYFDPGKGLNLWLAFGWIAANQSSGTILVHDCDIANYNLDLPLALALPVARLGYGYCKGYYSRVCEELFGRVTRLFVIPLVRSLVRVLGHMPLLDFIDSFRYPLSGEYSMSFETAMNLPIESGCALEIGSPCELHRNLDPKTICQVDQHVAQLNALSFDLSRETGAAKAFAETLGDVCHDFLQGRKFHSLPPWRLLLESDWKPHFPVIAD
jgi:glucosyl-3-phosphoglycerate synthase